MYYPAESAAVDQKLTPPKKYIASLLFDYSTSFLDKIYHENYCAMGIGTRQMIIRCNFSRQNFYVKKIVTL